MAIGANRDHARMAARTDTKLDRLAAAGLVDRRSAGDLLAVGRLGDIVTIASGTAVRGGNEPWTYCVLDGAALLSDGDRPLAVAGPGAWLLGQVPGHDRPVSPLSVIAGTDLEVLAFRPHDLEAAIPHLPALERSLRR